MGLQGYTHLSTDRRLTPIFSINPNPEELTIPDNPHLPIFYHDIPDDEMIYWKWKWINNQSVEFRPDTGNIFYDKIDYPGMLIVVDPPVDARISRQRIIMLVAIRPFWISVEEHHPDIF